MRYATAITFMVMGLCGCQTSRTEQQTSEAELKAVIRKSLERIETPVTITTSDLLGLTESQVLKKKGLARLKPEHGTTDKKWFSGGIVHFPRTPGDSYVWERCHVLTFEDNKVVKHEMVDRRTAHVSIRPREP